ncbi:hypothetical protein [Streptomyces sp. NPDC006334]|uniref:hypothetical protein n=1 Tax=Streptomyces sp. NPDC006334 TaxID=3156754 RepID=UPI0033A22CB5
MDALTGGLRVYVWADGIRLDVRPEEPKPACSPWSGDARSKKVIQDIHNAEDKQHAHAAIKSCHQGRRAPPGPPDVAM